MNLCAPRLARASLLAALLAASFQLAGCSPDPGANDPKEAGATEATDIAATTDSEVSVPVWLDVDSSIGLPQGEVDDGLAMLQAFHSPELEVLGVSVVYGNTELELAVPIARSIVDRFADGSIPVFVGAAGPEQLGEETEAVAGMAGALEESSLHLLSLGPVTNTATLLQLRPDLHHRIESIIVVAGRRPGQSFVTGDPNNLPHQDFNFELDPLAMQVLLDSEIPLVFAPWEVSSHVWLRQSDLDSLAERSEAGAWVKENTATWIERWRVNLGVDGFNPFDTLAIGWLTHPEMMARFEASAWIEEGEDDRAPGSGVGKPYLLVEEGGEGRQVTYMHTPSAEFQPLLVDRLAAPGLAE